MSSPVTRQPVDMSMEDRVLIGMIVSAPYLEAVRSIYQPDLLEGPFSKQIASWCFEYHSEYDKAPGLHIQDLFDKKVRGGELDPDTADLIERFLDRISNEHEKAPHLNHEFLLDETEKLFNRRRLKLLHEDLELALEQGESEEEIFCFLKDHTEKKFDARGLAFGAACITSTELLGKKVKMPKALLWPWLREKSLNMIYAERGIGKSWLGMMIAVALTREEYREVAIGEWYVKNPCGCLFVDGEMGQFDLQDRFRQIAEPLGKESRRFPLISFSVPDYVEEHQESVNLNSPQWQDRIYKYLMRNRNIRLLILDNLSSLCAGREENDNRETSLLNQWFIKLRAAGITLILVHHAGKSGKQRGASSLEDPLNNSIYLRKPKGWEQGGGAHFSVGFEKARNDPGGDGYRPFTVRLVEHPDSAKWRTWEIT